MNTVDGCVMEGRCARGPCTCRQSAVADTCGLKVTCLYDYSVVDSFT